MMFTKSCKTFLLACTFSLSALLSNPENIASPFFSIQEPQPLTHRPDETTKNSLQESFLYYCEDHRLTQDDSKCLYVTAILDITQEDLPSAKQALLLAIEKNPDFAAPRLQLPYVQLWMGQLQEAYLGFQNFNALYPCDPSTFAGLEQIADALASQEDTRESAFPIYYDLLDCNPVNASEILYKLGSTLAFAKRYEEAEEALLHSLRLDPKNSDSAMRLGYIYLWQQKYIQAKEIFITWSFLPEAEEALGTLALQESHYKEAECWYKKAKQDQGKLSIEAEQNLARALANQLKYTQAKLEYENLLRTDPRNGSARRELLEVKLHTNPSFFFNTQWTQAKENDPTLKKPVVRDYYYNGNATLQLPVFDRLRIDLTGYYGIQKERNILTPIGTLNYNAAITGGGITSRFFFAPEWTWNSFINVRSSWGLGNMLYPFQKSTEFQPGSYILYNGPTHLLATGGYVDSFLIKNFTTITSYLLETQSMDLRYRYRFSSPYQPELEGWAEKMFIKDHLHNQRTSESFWFRCGIPGIENNATFMYIFEHKHYDKLNINYYSFKQQWRDSAGLKLYGDWNSKTYIELLYLWKWQKTRDLFQPIGNFVFIAPLQILTINIVQGLIQFRTYDFLKTEVGVYYYRDTLPLRVWTVHGNLLWAF